MKMHNFLFLHLVLYALKISILLFWKNLNELAVTLLIRIPEVIGSTSDEGIGYPESFHDFPQSLQASGGILRRLSHGFFISNYFERINHQMLLILDTERIVH
jgi:hypothetical protein